RKPGADAQDTSTAALLAKSAPNKRVPARAGHSEEQSYDAACPSLCSERDALGTERASRGAAAAAHATDRVYSRWREMRNYGDLRNLGCYSPLKLSICRLYHSILSV